MKNTESKTNQYISRLDSVGHRRAYLDSRADDPYVVCFFGSAGTIRQLYEILRDFVPPDNIAWVVACARDEISALDVSALGKQVRASRRSDSVVLIEKGTVTSLVEKKVYLVAADCMVFIKGSANEGRLLEGRALGQPAEGELVFPRFRHTAEILGRGSSRPVRFVFLSCEEAGEFNGAHLKWLHDTGAKFFTPPLISYGSVGQSEGNSYLHYGGLTDSLVGSSLPYKTVALNELIAEITQSILNEIQDTFEGKTDNQSLQNLTAPPALPLTPEERDVVKYCAEQIKPVEWPRWNFFYRPQFLFESIKDVMGSLEKNYDNPDHRRDFLKDLKKPTSQAYGRLQAAWTPAASQFFQNGIAHWRTMVACLIRPLLDRAIRSKQKINLGVLGCGTGQEVYTLVILILEELERYNLRGSPSDIVRIIGYDIRAEYVDYLMAGRYHRDEHSGYDHLYGFEVGGPSCPEYQWIVDKYFTGPDVNGWLRITDLVRSMRTGRQMDVFLPSTEVEVPEFDLLFCRNVFIYLNDLGKQAVLNAWYPHLRRGANFVVTSADVVPLETELLTIEPGPLPYAYRLKLKD